MRRLLGDRLVQGYAGFFLGALIATVVYVPLTDLLLSAFDVPQPRLRPAHSLGDQIRNATAGYWAMWPSALLLCMLPGLVTTAARPIRTFVLVYLATVLVIGGAVMAFVTGMDTGLHGFRD